MIKWGKTQEMLGRACAQSCMHLSCVYVSTEGEVRDYLVWKIRFNLDVLELISRRKAR